MAFDAQVRARGEGVAGIRATLPEAVASLAIWPLARLCQPAGTRHRAA